MKFSGYLIETYPGSAAGRFLQSRDVSPKDFNFYGTRRGSNDIVLRSTFSAIRLRNELVPDREGSWTKVFPGGEIMSIFDAIQLHLQNHTPLIIIAGKNYGGGSSRDTAAKAPKLAGVQAVLAESFERIHRSNLISMGIAPLEFPDGVNRRTLGLTGSDVFEVAFSEDLKTAQLEILRSNGAKTSQKLTLRLDNEAERETFRHGGTLPQATRQFVGA